LGRGQTSTCYRCIHRQTREEYAVKLIKDASYNDPSDEIELLFRYNQFPHIIRVKQRISLHFKFFCVFFRYEMHFLIHQQFIL